MIRPVDVLLEFLAAEQTNGVTHVHLDDGAREVLRGLFNLSKSGKPAPATTPKEAPRMEISMDEPQLATVQAPLSIVGSSRHEQLDSLRRQAENLAPAKTLGTLRETLIFASGNPEARVMLIGEAPGYYEERERQPFVGETGQKLDDILKAMGLTREAVYLSNIVKFRPATPRQTTNNRKPSTQELAACLPLIRAEISIIRPQCIVILGEAAAEGLLGLTGSLATMRESWHTIEDIPVRVTYHPSTLLQTKGGLTAKRQLWEDLLAVMEKLELPISAKQRSFFLPKP